MSFAATRATEPLSLWQFLSMGFQLKFQWLILKKEYVRQTNEKTEFSPLDQPFYVP